jgi:hypothetical protein
VFSTFGKVLGLDFVEAEDDLTSATGPLVWYGAAAEMPVTGPGTLHIHASPEAATFFAGQTPRHIEDVTFTSWQGRRIPFLFDPGPGEGSIEGLDAHFVQRSEMVSMPHDLIASAFYFLSCWEETVIPDRDRHGRFSYGRSLAAQLGLSENVVDLYLDLFIALLNLAGTGYWPPVEIPTWAGGAPFVVCLTHDVDEVRKSRLSRLKFVWDHLARPELGHRCTPVHERTRFALITLLSSHDPIWTLPTFMEMERRLGFTASYYFQAEAGNGSVSHLSFFRAESHYTLSEARVRHFIGDLLENGFEVGLHGTYQAGFDQDKLLREKAALAAVMNAEPLGHRQHYLRMDYTTTLPIYERAGLQYDATLGYADHEGYRNQFSYPYHPYNHITDRPYQFLELPTVIMDVTLGGYRQLLAEQAWPVIETWLERICARRGCLTLLWHNIWDGIYPGYFALYPQILTWINEHGGQGLAGRDVLRQWVAR